MRVRSALSRPRPSKPRREEQCGPGANHLHPRRGDGGPALLRQWSYHGHRADGLHGEFARAMEESVRRVWQVL